MSFWVEANALNSRKQDKRPPPPMSFAPSKPGRGAQKKFPNQKSTDVDGWYDQQIRSRGKSKRRGTVVGAPPVPGYQAPPRPSNRRPSRFDRSMLNLTSSMTGVESSSPLPSPLPPIADSESSFETNNSRKKSKSNLFRPDTENIMDVEDIGTLHDEMALEIERLSKQTSSPATPVNVSQMETPDIDEKREPTVGTNEVNLISPEEYSPNEESPKDSTKLRSDSQDFLPTVVSLTEAEAEEMAQDDVSDNEVDEDHLAGGLSKEAIMSSVSPTQYDSVLTGVAAKDSEEQKETEQDQDVKRGLGLSTMSTSNSTPVETLAMKL